MKDFSQIKQLLARYTVQDVIDFTDPRIEEIMVPCSSTITETLQFMKQKNILSAPVFQNCGFTPPQADPKVFDIVSLIDICNYIVYKDNINEEISFQNLTTKVYVSSVFSSPISDVIEKKNTIVGRINGETPLLEVISELVDDRYNYALVDTVARTNPNTNPNDEKTAIGGRAKKVVMVKRHDILSFLNSINDKLQQALDLPVGKVMEIVFGNSTQDNSKSFLAEATQHPKLMSSVFRRSFTNLRNPCHEMILQKMPPNRLQDVLYITPRITAIEGYKMLLYNGISSLPILDDDLGFIAELDISHFHNLSSMNVGLLGKPVLAFISGLRSSSATSTDVKRPWFSTKSFTLNQIMFGMINSGYRQSWVLDSSNHIDAVVSIVDILDLFSKL